MTPLQPVTAGGLKQYGERLRRGEITAAQTVEAALEQVAASDEKYRAFVHVDGRGARAAANAIDALIASGADRGPLMGVPLAVKDLFAVDGMPMRVGSRLDLSDLPQTRGPEGPLIARLRQAGAILLGKTRMIEFAAGAHNTSHPAPWNPADPERHRSPGGSSNGSAVAVAAGYCPVAIGSDTGGSVRLPAALCGLVGHKASARAFSLAGAFPLCPAMDCVGIFAGCVEDAEIVQRCLSDANAPPPARSGLIGLRFGIPPDWLLADLDAEIAAVFDAALQAVARAGGRLIPLDRPEPAETARIAEIYAGLVPSDLIATLGKPRIEANRATIDPAALDRLDRAHGVSADAYAALARAQQALAHRAAARMAGLDAVLQPTAPLCAPPVEELATAAAAAAFSKRALGLTRLANVYGLTACSIPMRPPGQGLPAGLDIAGPAGSDLNVLDLARRIEHCLQA